MLNVLTMITTLTMVTLLTKVTLLSKLTLVDVPYRPEYRVKLAIFCSPDFAREVLGSARMC